MITPSYIHRGHEHVDAQVAFLAANQQRLVDVPLHHSATAATASSTSLFDVSNAGGKSTHD